VDLKVLDVVIYQRPNWKAIKEQQTEIEEPLQQLEEQRAELLELKNLIIGKQ
jgi:hypothetical protein